MKELEQVRVGRWHRMGSVWVGEMENLPGKEARQAEKWEAIQAEGTAYAKALRLKQGGR